MTPTIRDQLKYWGIAAAILFLLLWWLGDVILPFVIGAAVAYFLDPVADKLQRMGLSRAAATAVITISAVLIFVLIALLILPTLVQQAIEFFNIVPDVLRRLQDFLTERFPDLLDEGSAVRRSLNGVGETLQSKGPELLQTAMASAASLINVFMLFIIVPVVSFYLLYDWDNMIGKIDDMLPRDFAPTIRKLAREIDLTMAGFVRGMGTVCLILGTYYAVALMLAGLNFGLFVGAVAGILTFIPYVGALLGGILAIGLALFQFWGDWVSIGIVAAIFFAGQVIEGNIVTPKLVGDSVRLHPVWLLFAISAFAALFGFVGMLIAVPVAASIGVIMRFLIARYKESALYLGGAPDADMIEPTTMPAELRAEQDAP
ncbi:AI-2E family transporter [Pseudooceanicola nanhaiensis]|jgi:predicted PurR-regulated permease PerM|uniref:AI-2E family transporter n=1 Tax=Pseudooceanicola nanhaiensis TaxID=375761 RepID=A0A917SK80_9RHOB|nr:AI-2E family transporter [Pseudooceanicola nanhaiensis]GGL86005.1 AI-2E family transporter [Pseudooceanicola nanhaiensis]